MMMMHLTVNMMKMMNRMMNQLVDQLVDQVVDQVVDEVVDQMVEVSAMSSSFVLYLNRHCKSFCPLFNKARCYQQ